MRMKELIVQEVLERLEENFEAQFTSKEVAAKLNLPLISVMVHLSMLMKNTRDDNPLRLSHRAKLDRGQYELYGEQVYAFVHWRSPNDHPVNIPSPAPYPFVC